MSLLKPYLPAASGTPKFHEHGGALMALGFIHQKTKDQEVLSFLTNQIKNPQNN